MSPTNQTPKTQPPLLHLDPISEYRAWQALQIYFTVLLNRQLHRRFQLEQKAMQDLPVSRRFRPVILLEPVPTLTKPPTTITRKALHSLQAKVHLLRARVEKGKELASEIERRMHNTSIAFPTHFCHTCVVDGESGGVEVLLTKCGHRVCRTCLGFGTDGEGVYECSICFRPAQLVVRGRERAPVGFGVGVSGQRSCNEQIVSVSRRLVGGGGGGGGRAKGMVTPLVCPK